MNPKNVSKWELLGIPAYPIVEAMFAVELPSKLGMTPEAFVSLLAGLLTLAAMVRAGLAARKGATAGS